MQFGISVQGINQSDVAQVEAIIRQIFALMSLVVLYWEAVVFVSQSLNNMWQIITTAFLIMNAVLFLLLHLHKIIKYLPQILSIARVMVCAAKEK